MPAELKQTSTINAVIHGLDTRQEVLEIRFNYMEATMDENKQKLQCIDGKIDQINEHIVRQNDSLPRVEAGMITLLSRVEEQEKMHAAISTKSKLLWGLFASLLTGIGALMTKIFLGV